ncbi:MAG TPA: hypothetical protein VGJ05_19505 [Fimbriiglobus sp.]|jgi:hypothetical protein
MTDEDWFASADAVAMLRSIYPLPGADSSSDNTRHARLYLAACVRRQWPFLPWACRRLIEEAEIFADDPPRHKLAAALTHLAESLPGLDGSPEIWNELSDAVRLHTGDHSVTRHRPFRDEVHWQQVARIISFLYYRELPPYEQIRAAFHNADYVRDLFAMTKLRVNFDPSWRTDRSVGVARTMYENNRFDRMPILADALEDAGCDVKEILSHCRHEETPHVRGCWVVDLVLKKV